MQNPFVIACNAKIKNQNYEFLYGSYLGGSSNSCLVHVLWATNGIFSPNWDGTPDIRNPIIKSSYIGEFCAYENTNPAMFATQIIEGDEIPATAPFFIRVYNESSIDKATHYADSQILKKYNNVVLIAEIDRTIQILHSPEPSTIDTDNDGMTDYEESIAGTDPFDPESLLSLQLNLIGDNKSISWPAIIDKWYEVDRNLETLIDPIWEIILTVKADSNIMQVQLEEPDDPNIDHCFYRIKVLKD